MGIGVKNPGVIVKSLYTGVQNLTIEVKKYGFGVQNPNVGVKIFRIGVIKQGGVFRWWEGDTSEGGWGTSEVGKMLKKWDKTVRKRVLSHFL